MDTNKVRAGGTIVALVGMGLTVLAQTVGVDVASLHLPSWVSTVASMLGLGFTMIPHKDA